MVKRSYFSKKPARPRLIIEGEADGVGQHAFDLTLKGFIHPEGRELGNGRTGGMTQDLDCPQRDEATGLTPSPAGITEQSPRRRCIESVGCGQRSAAGSTGTDLQPDPGALEESRLKGLNDGKARPVVDQIEQLDERCVQPGLFFVLRREPADQFRRVNGCRIPIEVLVDPSINGYRLSLSEHVKGPPRGE